MHQLFVHYTEAIYNSVISTVINSAINTAVQLTLRKIFRLPVRERDYHGDCERSRKSQRLKAARRQPLDRSPSQHNVESRSPSQKRLLKFNTDES